MFGSHIQDAVFPDSAFEYSKPAYPGTAQVRCQVDLGFFGHPARAPRQCPQLVHRRGEHCGICNPGVPIIGIPSSPRVIRAAIIRLLHRKGSAR
jgi:hypothetical protein